jgi:6-phospho-3-hexuloisomerase
VVVSAQAAEQFGARLAVLTIDRRSMLGELADLVVEVPASSPKLEGRGRGAVSVQPLGTLFEQALALTCDALVSGLMRRLGVSEQAMFARHANVE